MPELTLSADEARRIALRAQGLLGADGRRGGVPGVLRRLGAVQLDTISVLARSHELVAYARLGPVPRERIEKAYWSPSPARAFEYWSHAACVLPVEEWPWFAFRRRHFRARGIRWHEVPQKACDRVLERLRDEGPLTTKELGGAKRSVEWWDWSDVKIAVEWLLDIGEVVCVERRGWRRVYDLAERALPPEVLGPEPSDEECFTRLVGLAGRALGIAAVGDLAEYHRLKRDQVEAALAESGLVQVDVEGWGNGAWADPDAVRLAGVGPAPHDARLLVRSQNRGVCARAQAQARLLCDAAAGRRPPGRAGRPAAGRLDARRSAGLARARGAREHGRGAARGCGMGRLRGGGGRGCGPA